MKNQRFFAVACASAMLLIGASAFADDAKCRDAFNKANRNVGNQEQKANRKCIKDNISGDGTTCVNGESAKALDKRSKVNGLFLAGGKCETLPAFGVNATPGNGNDAVDAVEGGTDNVLKDLWDDPVDGIVAGDKCEDAVAKRTGKIYDTILKAFRKCNKDTSPGSQVALDGCVATAIADAKVTTFAGKLSADVASKCNPSAPIVDGTDDGTCGSAPDQATFSSCALADAKCNACLAINTTTGGSAPCDSLDNGSVDGSCGGAPSHKCTFDETVDTSNLQLFLGGNTDLSALVSDIAGAIDIKCDPATQDVNGKRVCTCELQAWVPPSITGIGFICIDPGPPCPTGEVDCDGGNALGLEAEDSSQIGACTTHAGCSTDCDTHCATLSKVQWRSGCEDICQGGTRNGLACICDQVGSSGCVGGVAGTDDCPGGSCVGKNNEADQDCQCQCLDYAAGGAGGPGALQCNLSSDIKVVAFLPCTNPALVDLPPICAPFSSQTAKGTTSPANEGTSPNIGPNTLNGTSETCANFDTSVTTGYTLVGDFGFFDSTVGDIRTPFTADCE